MAAVTPDNTTVIGSIPLTEATATAVLEAVEREIVKLPANGSKTPEQLLYFIHLNYVAGQRVGILAKAAG